MTFFLGLRFSLFVYWCVELLPLFIPRKLLLTNWSYPSKSKLFAFSEISLVLSGIYADLMLVLLNIFSAFLRVLASLLDSAPFASTFSA